MNTVSASGTTPIACLWINHLQVLLQSRSIIASKFSRNLAQSGLQVYLHTSLIVASKFAWSWPSVSLQTHSITASKFTHSRPQVHFQTHSMMPSKGWQSSLYLRLDVHLQSCSFTASEVTQSCPPPESSNSLDHGHKSTSQSLLDHRLQAHLRLLSTTACSQSRYTIYWWIAI